MALASYSNLVDAVGAWLKRSDLAANIPDFVALAEARFAREIRVRAQVTTTALTCTAGSQSLALPTDFLELENLTAISGGVGVPMSVMTPEQMDVRFPAGGPTGVPRCYAMVGTGLVLGPTPDATYTISCQYYARFWALNPIKLNWLLTNHPAIYLFATLVEAELFCMNDDRAATWEAKYQSEKRALKSADDAAARSGSAMRIRAL